MDNEDIRPQAEEEVDEDEEEVAHKSGDSDDAISVEPPDGWENPQTPDVTRGAPSVP